MTSNIYLQQILIKELSKNSRGSLLDVELVEVGVLVELLEASSGNPSSSSIVTGVSANPASSQAKRKSLTG